MRAPERPGGGVAGVVREQAVGERGEHVAAADGVVALPLLGRLRGGAFAGRRVLGEHVGDTEGVEAEEHGFLPEVPAGAVQRLDWVQQSESTGQRQLQDEGAWCHYYNKVLLRRAKMSFSDGQERRH